MSIISRVLAIQALASVAAAASWAWASMDTHAVRRAPAEPARIVLPADSSDPTARWKILIDPGHGGKSSAYPQLGTRGEHASSERPGEKSPEREVNLRASLALEKELKSDSRFTVLMTRRTNKRVSLTRRAEMSNSEKVDAFLSIHSNAVADGPPQEVRERSRGFTPIFSYRTGSDTSTTRSPIMAGYLAASLVEAGFKPAGIGRSPKSVSDCKGASFVSYWPTYGITSIWKQHKGLTVLTQNERPAVLLETHYMSSPEDVESFQKDESMERFAKALHKGLVTFLQNQDSLTVTGDNPDPLSKGITSLKHADEGCKKKG